MQKTSVRQIDGARFKMLMKYKKEWLVFLCQSNCLDYTGSKEALAARLTVFQTEQATRAWDAIANGGKTHEQRV